MVFPCKNFSKRHKKRKEVVHILGVTYTKQEYRERLSFSSLPDDDAPVKKDRTKKKQSRCSICCFPLLKRRNKAPSHSRKPSAYTPNYDELELDSERRLEGGKDGDKQIKKESTSSANCGRQYSMRYYGPKTHLGGCSSVICCTPCAKCKVAEDCNHSDVTYNVVLLGDSHVGKTSLLRCFTQEPCVDKLLPTLVADYVRHTFTYDGLRIKLHVWDSPGKERFRTLTKRQLTGINGIVIVFDLTKNETFLNVDSWIDTIHKTLENSAQIPLTLAGNKAEMENEREVSFGEAKEYSEKHLMMEYMEVSMLSRQRIHTLLYNLAIEIALQHDSNKVKNHTLPYPPVHYIFQETE